MLQFRDRVSDALGAHHALVLLESLLDARVGGWVGG